MQIHDLSMPVDTGHFRWPIERGKRGDFEQGSAFESTWMQTSCHGFTHMDAACHMVPGGKTTSELELSRVVGRAAVIDLSDIEPMQQISATLLAERAAHLK
ncbi:MAG: cyclase family protein, partial [Burkholderiaceae bacterium]